MKSFSIAAAITITIALVPLLFASCEKEDLSKFKLDLPEVAFSDVNIRCYPTSQGTVIDSDSAYQAFQEQHEGDNCADFGYPSIDFSTQTLLGIQRGVGCELDERYWNVYEDKTNKKYVFQAISEGKGNCEALFLDQFWVTIPKLPTNYDVEFVEYEY